MKVRGSPAVIFERQASGKLKPIKAKLIDGKLTVKGKEGTIVVSEERCVGSFKGKPAWIIPAGKGEPLPIQATDTKSLISADIMNEMNENQYVRQVFQAMRDAAHQKKTSEWMLIGLLVVNILVTFWIGNEVKDAVNGMFRYLSTVHPMPTVGPGA